MMRHKPIHYHVYPDLGDWEYEYSNNTGLGSVVNGQCECGDEIATVRNQMNAHIWDRTVHVTLADRDRWDAGGNGGNVDLSSLSPVAFSGSYNDLSNKPTIPQLDTVNSKISQIETKIAPITQLKQIAYTALYADLIGTPNIPQVISTLSSTATNPVESWVIKQALDEKADLSALSAFTTANDLTQQLSAKQDKLTEGDGIDITNNVISCTLDTDVYVMTNDINGIANPDPDKIYILESKVGNTYSYEQYRYKNGQWVYIGIVEPTVDLSDYLTEDECDYRYQPKGEYLTALDLTPYAKTQALQQVIDSLLDYALASYVSNSIAAERQYADATFLKKSEYTNPSSEQPTTVIVNNTNVTVDAELDPTSPNPVENRAVYAELNKKATKAQLLEYAKLTDLAGKADITYLADFVTHQYFTNLLANKQNRLQAGEGILIVNDVISTDLDIDTDVYVIVDELPTVNIESNKIYLKPTEDLENPGNIIYSQYKYDEDEDEWIPLGQIQPTIDLLKYITRLEAAESFAPRYDYATSVQLETLRLNIEDLFLKKGDYITLTYADDTYQPKGNYITSVNLAGYAKLTDLNGLATEQYVQLLLAGITPGTTTNTTIVNNNVEVDIELSATSSNPVENRAIYAELAKKANTDDLLSYATRSDLQTKADKTQLNNYVRNDVFTTALGTKLDVLTEGSGISIDENNEISVTLDTEPFVIVDELPTTNINPNKIYLVQHEENGEVYYTEHRRDTQNNTWIDLGTREINIDLSDYIKETDADRKYLIAPGTYLTPEAAEETYQHIDDYILRSEVQRDYQEKGDYVDKPALSALYATILNTFLKKSDFGTYLTYAEAVHLFSYIQLVIDSRYVLKTDVRNKMHIQVDSWGTMMPAQMPISGNALPGSGGSSSGSISNMITLSTDEYAALVAADLVDENTYYFTYEKTTWGFGDQFPIILTDGSTPDSIGTFPITLN